MHMAHSTLREQWGDRLRSLRKERGLTVEAFAELVHLDPSNVSRIELGTIGTRDETRMRIAAALGVRVEDIFDYPNKRAAS